MGYGCMEDITEIIKQFCFLSDSDVRQNELLSTTKNITATV